MSAGGVTTTGGETGGAGAGITAGLGACACAAGDVVGEGCALFGFVGMGDRTGAPGRMTGASLGRVSPAVRARRSTTGVSFIGLGLTLPSGVGTGVGGR